MKWWIVIVTCVCVVQVHADTGIAGFNLQQFRAPSDGQGLYGTYNSSILPAKKLHYGLWSHYSRHVASAVMPARGTEALLVSSHAVHDFSFATGLWNRMTLGVTLPVLVTQRGMNFNTLQEYNDVALGDARVDLKWRFSPNRTGSVGSAVVSTLAVPTGKRTQFTGDGALGWEGRLVVDKDVGPVSLAANIGYRAVRARTVLATQFDDRLVYAMGVEWRLPMQSETWALRGEVAGEAAVQNNSELSSPIELRAGLRKRWSRHVDVHLGAGAGLNDAYGSPSIRIIGGVQYTWRGVHAEPELPMSVYFAFDESELGSQEREQLTQIAEYMQSQHEETLVVVGHTDAVGAHAYNEELGLWRAQSVAGYLQENGVAASQLNVQSAGERLPQADNTTDEGRAKNRRVDVQKGAQN